MADREWEPRPFPEEPEEAPEDESEDESEDAPEDEPEALYFAPPRRRGRTCLTAIVVIGLLAGTIGAAAWFYAYRQVFPGGGQGAEVAVEIRGGTGVSAVASILESKAVIPSALFFRAYVRFRASGLSVLEGDYVFRKNSSAPQVIEVLRQGPRPASVRRFTIPEGLTLAQMTATVGTLPGLSGERFIALATSGSARWRHQPGDISLMEGLLFPDTYDVFEEGLSEEVVLRTMLDRFEEVWDSLDTRRLAELGVTPYQAVIVASLVEEEAKVPEDRELIASVIYNRLQAGIPLQIDATILYAIGHKETVLYEDLEVDSPYNTYKYEGLVPTPIGAPGRESLEAALGPASTGYIYYVLCEKRGKHCFTDNLDEFNRLKAKAIEEGIL